MVQGTRAFTFLVIGSLAAACGEASEERADEPTPVVSETTAEQGEQEPMPFDSLPMPDFPEPRRGHLVAKGAGTYMLDGAWEAIARKCDDPPMMQVLAQQPGFGTIVLLQLPPEGERLTDYPVTIVEQGIPDPPASQVGVQVFQGGSVATFQAMEGGVTVFGYGQLISGQFAVVLREVSTEELQKYAGTFQSVPIEAIPEDDCRQLREALAASDSSASDSVPQ
jgi:hypothetical protein